ncbi:hypothetical protein DFH09DRAFT_1438481 [Mycena vulgaris]|nr:hypothetical protein DFH09DRAFT_1438481 [Mycena vulgaris]
MSPPHVDNSKCDWIPSYLKALTLEYTITLFSPHANNGRPPATSHYREHTREQDGCTVLVPPPATRAGPDLPPPYTPGPATASAAGALPAPTETTLDFNIPTNTNAIGATQVNMSGASELTDSTCEDATTNRAKIENTDVGIATKLKFGVDCVESIVSGEPDDGIGYTLQSDCDVFCMKSRVGHSCKEQDLRRHNYNEEKRMKTYRTSSI